MLSISGLKNFYYLPTFHDMRCKAPRISIGIHIMAMSNFHVF